MRGRLITTVGRRDTILAPAVVAKGLRVAMITTSKHLVDDERKLQSNEEKCPSRSHGRIRKTREKAAGKVWRGVGSCVSATQVLFVQSSYLLNLY